jgi:DNA-binding NarL/FixJ family response regulator
MLLPDGSGALVAEGLRRAVPGVRCLVLSRTRDPATVRAAVRAGVRGYLVKHVSGPALADAVLRVAAGRTAFGPEAVAALAADGADRDGDLLRELTGQECRILRLIGEGLSNREIGERLRLAEKTVKNYTTALLGKLGLANRTQAAVLATRLRAAAPDDGVPAGRRSRPGDGRRGSATLAAPTAAQEEAAWPAGSGRRCRSPTTGSTSASPSPTASPRSPSTAPRSSTR